MERARTQVRPSIDASERRANGYRTFAESAVDQVIRIRTLLDAGLTVEDARPLLHCFSESNRPVACPALAAQVRRAIEDLDRQGPGCPGRGPR